jgi:hypothetical protein
MLLSISKREAIARVGHPLGTTTREMAKVLRDGGLEVGRGLRRLSSLDRISSPRALLLGTWRRYPHWMVWQKGLIIDPVEGKLPLSRGVPRWIRVTHYLPVS